MLVDRVKNENCSTVANVLSIPTTSKPNDGCGYHENGIDVRQRKNPPRRARLSTNKALLRRGHVLDDDLKFLDGPIEEDKVMTSILSQTFKV